MTLRKGEDTVRFGKSFGPVVRHTKKWMSYRGLGINLYKKLTHFRSSGSAVTCWKIRSSKDNAALTRAWLNQIKTQREIFYNMLSNSKSVFKSNAVCVNQNRYWTDCTSVEWRQWLYRHISHETTSILGMKRWYLGTSDKSFVTFSGRRNF